MHHQERLSSMSSLLWLPCRFQLLLRSSKADAVQTTCTVIIEENPPGIVLLQLVVAQLVKERSIFARLLA